ncbi:hypothetical protein G647_09473 [Cladophialophora carrionii CBS 160.54]|uniref:Transcription factor domain-containing protein n=1 Tax=Cladophialophora carrionii CBS 160.54 TaxID=1279043 RepID=V9CYC1_9EURO|nr:uncharacterized protein G647_09473 [Cladophialophora carrionii CBS 160.54]ETI19639.1 hypothetical protein G647_09473 [Cladophialophora carrionii CBS 160.54]
MTVLNENPAQFEFATFNSLKIDAQRPASTKAPFLFIVKTPSSDTLSRSTTRSAAASINSHAQRWAQEVAVSQGANGAAGRRDTDTLAFEKCMMRCRVSRLLEDPSKPAKSKRSGSGKRVSRSAEKRSRRTTPQPSEKTGGTTSEKGSSTSPEAEPRPRAMSDERRVSQAAPLLTPGGTRYAVLDPFDSTPLANDGDVQPILQYFLSFTLLSSPQASSNGHKPPDAATIQHISSISAIMQGCMNKSVHLYALLAATASRMRRVSGVSFRADNGPEIYLHKALQCLRMLLDNDSQSAIQDRQIILDIYYLSVCGWYMERYEESKTHFNVLKHFWKSLTPGLSTLDQYIYDLLSYNTIFLEADASKVLDSMGPNRFDHLAGHGTMPQPLAWQPQYPVSVRHCSALPRTLEQTSYSPDLREIVQELRSLLLSYNTLSQRSILPGPERDGIQWKSRSLALRLLEQPSYGDELCCRLALIILLRSISTGFLLRDHPDNDIPVDPVLVTRRLKLQLQYEILLPANEISPVALPTAPQIWTGKSNHLLLWILIAGLFGARLTDQKSEYDWFWSRVKALMRLLEVSTMSGLRDLVTSFAFVEGMLADQRIDGVLVDEGPE